jgi:hypothetical protein
MSANRLPDLTPDERDRWFNETRVRIDSGTRADHSAALHGMLDALEALYGEWERIDGTMPSEAVLAVAQRITAARNARALPF